MSFRTSIRGLPGAHRRRQAGGGTRFSQRLGPLQVTVSSRSAGYYLRASIWGTGLWWEYRLGRKRSPRR